MLDGFLRMVRRLRPEKLVMRDSDLIDFMVTEDGIRSIRRDGEDGPSWTWSEVNKIEAYKIDLMTYDEMAVRFDTTKGRFNILEGHSVFPQLAVLLPRHLGVSESWYFDLMHPPFAENRAVLYERDANKSMHATS